MNCETCRDLLPDYVEGQIDETGRHDLERHLEECATCRAERDAEARLSAALTTLPRYAPGDAVSLRVMEQTVSGKAAQPRTEFGPVLDLNDLAAYLRVDADTVGMYLEEIPSFELGGKILFRTKSVDAWIEEREAGPGYYIKEPAFSVTDETHTGTEARGGSARWTL